MLTDWLSLPSLATLVDFMGTLLIGVAALRTLVRYLLANDVQSVLDTLQRTLAADLLTALSFKSGAGILRTLTIADWPHFALVLAIISLRFFLGKTFSWIYPAGKQAGQD